MSDEAYEVVEITDGERTVRLKGGSTFKARCQIGNILIISIPAHTLASGLEAAPLCAELKRVLQEKGFKGELLLVSDDVRFMRLKRVGEDANLPS